MSARASIFGGKTMECTTMCANLLREEFSVKRIAPFEVATLGKYQYRRVRQHTHGLAIKMSLSGEDDYVGIDVVVIVFEASYR
jgi:hypothetical protein